MKIKWIKMCYQIPSNSSAFGLVMVHSVCRLSYELLSPLTSLSLGISLKGGCSSEVFSWWEENFLQLSFLKSLDFSKQNNILNRWSEWPNDSNEFLCLLFLCCAHTTPCSILYLRDGLWLDCHQWWHIPIESICEKLAFSSHTKKPIMSKVPDNLCAKSSWKYWVKPLLTNKCWLSSQVIINGIITAASIMGGLC